MKIVKTKLGVSVIELVLVTALFAIFAPAAVTTVVQTLRANRLGSEQTVATQFASEGIDAARSIKNQDFANLVNSAGTGVVRTGSNVWGFGGSNNTLFHNTGDNYIRVITVSDVLRDGSGNIVASGGTVDPDSKKITSTVSWKVTPSRADSVIFVSYFTNWKKPIITAVNRGGILVYGDGGTTSDAIKYRILDTDLGTWSAASATADVDGSSTNKYLRRAQVFASKTRNEKILISRHYNGTTQFIYSQVFNGSSWSNVILLSSWAATTFLDVHNFDGTYLENGDFMVVYSDNTTTPKFRVWNGTSWSASSISAQNAGGIPNVIVAKARSGTNEVMVATFDQTSDTNTQYFNGGAYQTSSWTAHAEHSAVAPTNTKRHIDFVWSPNTTTKGALIYPNSGTDTTLNLKIWTANGSGSGSWSTAVDSSASGGRLGPVSIDGRHGADEFLSCHKDANSDIYCFKGNATPSWTSPSNNILTTTSHTGIQRSFDLAYEGVSGALGIAVYSDNTATPKYRKYNPTTNAFDSSATNINSLGATLTTVRQISLSDNDGIIILMGNANNDLFSIVWDGANDAMYTTPAGKAFSSHGTNGSATTDFWYDFAWDRF